MVRVRVVGRGFRYNRQQYEGGDELDVEERTLERHPNTLQEVVKAEPEDEPEDESGEDEPMDVSDHTVEDIRQYAEDTRDVDDLKAVLEAEMRGENRMTAVKTLESRIEDLEG